MSGKADKALVDTRFSLPSVDDEPSIEVGVILMALDAERLLAGLGLATLAQDPALVTLTVDLVRHDAMAGLTAEGLIELGVRHWRSAHAALVAANLGASMSGSLRKGWVRTARAVHAAFGDLAPASAVYLTACWLRRDDVEKLASDGPPPDKGEL